MGTDVVTDGGTDGDSPLGTVPTKLLQKSRFWFVTGVFMFFYGDSPLGTVPIKNR